MQQNFAASLSAVLKTEGGFVNDPHDPGGATNMGITRQTLASWRHIVPWQALPIEAVKLLSRDEAADIYKAEYWDRIDGDNLPAGVDYAVFDYAVNSGWPKAVMTLQQIVGVPDDGKIGPITLAAIAKERPVFLITKLCAMRLGFLGRLSTWAHFGTGWTNRVHAVEQAAMNMVPDT